ncbi:MAG: ABC transporter ATP-binding protein [Desulfobacteraceae bacterium]|uniref:ABC transporter ATP-binding protein n=1 Tax=Candidatus Desulfacyla euxinica TaxID=2841693 RepID=A0A8J6T8J4_9DELT|nr:ABC transporter ATP-binding protein [Candidatus Desulfacyla euxinica]MBL6979032.1 ABC transporter ATP-binding protein [Desulfobacteraceae bacterium]
MPLLEMKDVDTFYGELQALFKVSIEVDRGRIVSVLGANGAGKSTLLKSISGLLETRSGNIVFDGKRIDGLPPHDIVDLGLSLVPEGRKIFSSLTVRENLMIGSYTPKARKQSHKTLKGILKLFPSLHARISQKGTDLSGGEQQMLAIGRALMSRPRFIIFDEISLGLSPLVVKELYRAVKKINQEGMTVVLVEQDVKRSLKVADFAYILQEGKVTLQGNPRHLTEETVKRAYFGL